MPYHYIDIMIVFLQYLPIYSKGNVKIIANKTSFIDSYLVQYFLF